MLLTHTGTEDEPLAAPRGWIRLLLAGAHTCSAEPETSRPAQLTLAVRLSGFCLLSFTLSLSLPRVWLWPLPVRWFRQESGRPLLPSSVPSSFQQLAIADMRRVVYKEYYTIKNLVSLSLRLLCLSSLSSCQLSCRFRLTSWQPFPSKETERGTVRRSSRVEKKRTRRESWGKETGHQIQWKGKGKRYRTQTCFSDIKTFGLFFCVCVPTAVPTSLPRIHLLYQLCISLRLLCWPTGRVGLVSSITK